VVSLVVELLEQLEGFFPDFPFTLSVIKDAEAVEMAQPVPTKLTSLTMSFSILM